MSYNFFVCWEWFLKTTVGFFGNIDSVLFWKMRQMAIKQDKTYMTMSSAVSKSFFCFAKACDYG